MRGGVEFKMDYLDKIITDWHEKNLSSPEDITEYIKEQKQKAKEIKAMKTTLNSDQTSIQKFFDTNNQFSDIDKFYSN